MVSKTRSLQNSKFCRAVLGFFAQDNMRVFTRREIMTHLDLISSKNHKDFTRLLDKMVADGQIEKIAIEKYRQIPQKQTILTGTIKISGSGYAFVTVGDLDQAVFIPKGKTGYALEGDKVNISLGMKKAGKRIEGKVIEVLERKKKHFVGILQLAPRAKYGFVVVDNNTIHVDIYIPREGLKGVRDHDKVIARVIDWPQGSINPLGEIVEVLGVSGEHEVEMHAILAEYDLRYQFPAEVEAEARQISTRIAAEEIARRRDMRSIITFTVDPFDAKDFDDALSIRKLDNGHWKVGVHIADVSHYVREDSLLDKEAYERATSVYLVDRVVPMLPEVLSNELCSLRPNEEKLSFSAIFEMNDRAKVLNSWFGRTVIRSDRRFTYEEVQKVIETKKGDFSKEILTLNRLAKTLKRERMKRGAISFDTVEVKFRLDERHQPIEVYVKEAKEANHMIEEFMLLANKKVSEFVSLDIEGRPSQRTYIYRVHDEPDAEKLQQLKQFIKPLGYTLDLRNRQTITDSLNALLKSVQGKPEQNMIDTLAMRVMSKATYSTENIGHYGLALAYYTHFTSPIRRYPDIMAHRLLHHRLLGGESVSAMRYEEQSKHCSWRERLATEAERDSIKYMQVKYLKVFVGEVFEGIVSGVTDWGIYIELLPVRADGMIRLRNMTDDLYTFDPDNHSVTGKRYNRCYQLGQKVSVEVVRADVEKKQLDLRLVY
ncbi:MAG: ribonuclease R [Flavobacteriales bacterium]